MAERPDRVLWASDWPHTELEPPLPQTEDLIESLAQRVPRVDDRHQILVVNPATLYGFDR